MQHALSLRISLQSRSEEPSGPSNPENESNESNEPNDSNESNESNESKEATNGLNESKEANELSEATKEEAEAASMDEAKSVTGMDVVEGEKAGNEEREKMNEGGATRGESARDSTSVFVMTPEGAELSAGVTPVGNADMTESLAPENPNNNTQSKDCCIILWSVF